MRLGVAPLYPMIISQKTVWLEEFPEAVEDWAAGGYLSDIVHILLPSTPHHIHNQASKTWS